MKPICLVLAGAMLAASGVSAAEARRADLAPAREGKLEKMAPFNVREAVFPSIDVQFELAGKNLADNLADPIVDALIIAVDDDGMGARMGLQVGDSLVGLNGLALRGLTIRQLAALVADARNKKSPLIWDVHRGIVTFTVRFNGKWDTPLPGLNR